MWSLIMRQYVYNGRENVLRRKHTKDKFYWWKAVIKCNKNETTRAKEYEDKILFEYSKMHNVTYSNLEAVVDRTGLVYGDEAANVYDCADSINSMDENMQLWM